MKEKPLMNCWKPCNGSQTAKNTAALVESVTVPHMQKNAKWNPPPLPNSPGADILGGDTA